MSDTKREVKRHLLPEGRLINEALFTKDAYKGDKGQPGVPKYKVELTFDPAAVTGQGTIEDELINEACDEWGDPAEQAFLNGVIRSPLLNGDRMAEKRAAKGKPGDAYRGKIVVRADTIYNHEGRDAPGGVYVCGADATRITPAQAGEIYPGCYGQAVVTISTYLDNRGEQCLKFYLVGFQKTRDGERLIRPADYSQLFKPVGRTAGADGQPAEGRRSRRG